MRTVTYRLVDLIRAVIPLGFRGENEYTRIIFDSKKAFEEYPTAVPSLAVTPPQGDSYPAVIVREGDLVYWDIVDSDVAYEGDGEGQLTFSVDSVVRKSYIFKTKISRSILPTGTAPSPIDDFITRAGAALTAIPQTIENALTEAKESGEFDGEDGVSPTLSVTDLSNGHRITIVDASGTRSFDVLDGEDGQPGDPGQPGADGVSPTLAVTNITGGHRITITDATGTRTVDVMDGAKGDPGDPTTLIDDTTPAANKTFSSNKLDSELTDLKSAINVLKPAATASDVGKALVVKTVADGKPTEFEYSESGGGGAVDDVQINGTSVVSSGVANIPIAGQYPNRGVVTVYPGYGLSIRTSGTYAGMLQVNTSSDAQIKSGSNDNVVTVPANQHKSVFYGLAKAAGDSTQASSSNTVGNYTEDAKSSISQMLDAPETISGTTPSITAKAGVRYICGECSTLTIVVPSSGCIDVTFTSGSTPTVLTVTPPTGMTMKWANGFDPTSLEANTTYEINILDGCLGVVGSWT